MPLTKPRAYQIYDIDYKQAVRVVTISNVTLSGGAPNSVDGVNLSLNDRILVIGQTNAVQNGIYYVTTLGTGSNGTWSRSSDTDATGELLSGTIVMVTEGTGYADTQWKLTTNDPITIGVTALTFVQNYLANSISFGQTSFSIGSSNANANISVNGTSNVAVFSTDRVTISGNLLPSANITYDLGSTTQRWKDLWLSNSTIYLGSSQISANATSITITNPEGGNTVFQGASPTITGAVISASGNITGGNLLTGGLISASSNITGGNLLTSGLVSATGNITGNYIIGNGSQLTGLPASYSNTNVSSFLAAFGSNTISTTGNITAGNVSGGNLLTGGLISATGNITSSGNISGSYILGNGSQLTGLPATYGNTNVAAYLASGTDTSNIITTANVTGGNLVTGGVVSATGNISSSGNVSASFFLGNGSQLTGISALTSGFPISAGTSNIAAATNGNIGISIGGTSNIVTVASTGQFVSGLISASGNITSAANISGGNVLATTLVSAATVSGSVISASANVTGGNLITGGLISSTGNATVGNISATIGSFTTFNSSQGGNVTGTLIATSSNAQFFNQTNGSGYFTVAGYLSAAGNVTGGNILTAGLISATGNITGGNLNLLGNIVDTNALTISTGSGDLTLAPAGNIVLGNRYINGVQLTPVQNSDVASKYYVDLQASSPLSYHTAVVAATTVNLATTTGGTITYNQPNGAGNGIGATLTTTGSFNLIDTANVQTVGTRILVKNEANGAHNGVYSWSNATVITRTTDADEYGPNSSEQLSLNDYFFVTSGNVNLGSAYVVDSPTGTITFGTSNIQFAQFSQAQIYSANTSAGLSLTGQTFSAKVDNTTTAFDGGGNIIVKASAALTTPNIGAATGTSLSTTGNVTGGNLLTGGLISATSTITGSSLLGSVVSASSNVTGGNVLTGGIVSATSNITGGNLITGGLISATGNISSTGNISGVYILGNGSQLTGLSATYGNTNVASYLASGTNSSNIVTTANVSGGNIVTTGTGKVFGYELTSTQSAGDEGGQINLSLAATNTTLSGSFVVIDIFQNKLRFFEGGGSARGAYIDLTSCSAGVGTNLLAGGGGGGTPGGANTQVQFNDGGAFGGNGQFTYNKVTNTLTVGIVSANNNGAGTNFQVGDDAWIGDINVADTIGIRGQQNAANGYIVFGNASSSAQLGRSGTGPLTYAGAFSASGNVTGGNIISLGTLSTVGKPTFGAVTMPNVDGTANQLLATYGNGALYFASVSAGNILAQTFTGNGVQTVFTLSSAPPSINSTLVSYNGAMLLRSSYTLSGADITFTSAPANGSSIEVTIINPGSGGLSGTPTAAGTDTQIQFNDGGIFGANANLTFNKSSGVFTAKNLASGGSINETVYTITDGASVDLNPTNGTVQLWTLGASRTPTASSFSAGQSMTLMVNANVYSITWTSVAVSWVGNSAPTLSSTGNTVIVLWKVASTVYGALTGTV